MCHKGVFKGIKTMYKKKQKKIIILSVITMVINLALLILFTGVWSSYPEKGIMLTAILNMLVAVVVMIGEAEG